MIMLRLGIFVSLVLFVNSKSTQKASKSALGPPQPRNNSKTQVNSSTLSKLHLQSERFDLFFHLLFFEMKYTNRCVKLRKIATN